MGAGGAETTRGGDVGAGSGGAGADAAGDDDWHASCGASSPALERLQQYRERDLVKIHNNFVLFKIYCLNLDHLLTFFLGGGGIIKCFLPPWMRQDGESDFY